LSARNEQDKQTSERSKPKTTFTHFGDSEKSHKAPGFVGNAINSTFTAPVSTTQHATMAFKQPSGWDLGVAADNAGGPIVPPERHLGKETLCSLWCTYNQVEVVKEQLREDGTSVGRGLVAAIDFAVGEVVLQERGNCLKSPTVGTTSGGLICLNSALETVVSSKAEEGKLSVQSGPYAGSGGYIYKYGLVSGFSEFVCLFCPELLHIQIYLCVRYFKKKFFSFDWIIPYTNMDWFQLFQEKVFLVLELYTNISLVQEFTEKVYLDFGQNYSIYKYIFGSDIPRKSFIVLAVNIPCTNISFFKIFPEKVFLVLALNFVNTNICLVHKFSEKSFQFRLELFHIQIYLCFRYSQKKFSWIWSVYKYISCFSNL
jgi:hypothetical protein